MAEDIELKPKETWYQGVRFRSRLEARWAVFLDDLQLPWYYEYEGFDLPCGPYLPDFWLPSLEIWYEIKPVRPTVFEETKASELAKASGKNVLIEFGGFDVPPTRDGEPSESAYEHSSDSWDNCYWWCQCDKCGKISIEFEGRIGRACSCRGENDRGNMNSCETPLLKHAYVRARNFRFY